MEKTSVAVWAGLRVAKIALPYVVAGLGGFFAAHYTTLHAAFCQGAV